MQIQKVLKLRGPNIWANFPVLEVWIELEEFKDTSSEMIPGFNERMMGWLPIDDRASLQHRRARRVLRAAATWHLHGPHPRACHARAAIARRHRSRFRPRARRASKAPTRSPSNTSTSKSRLAALDTAFELLLAAVHDRPFDVNAEVEKLRGRCARTFAWARALGDRCRGAGAQTSRCMRLDSESLVQLGYGSRQRRINAAETDRTGAIAEAIASDKQLTRKLLKAVGVPVADGRAGCRRRRRVGAAEEMGGPVVVKPLDGNHGRGVATNLTTREQVMAAYEACRCRKARPLSSSSSCRATTTACWSSATSWWPRHAASRRT